MRLIVQRVSRSAVSVEGKQVSQAGRGLMVLVGISRDDNDQDISTLAKKLVNLRVFAGPPSEENNNINVEPSAASKNDDNCINVDGVSSSAPFYIRDSTPGAKTWNKSCMDIGGDIMLVSQFTLAHVMKGNKPDFHLARGTEEARVLFDNFVKQVNTLYDAFIKEKNPPPPKQQKGGKKTQESASSVEEAKSSEKKEDTTTTASTTTAPLNAFRGRVAVGAFGEHMEIQMECDGPVTIVLDSNLGEKEAEKKRAIEEAKKALAAESA